MEFPDRRARAPAVPVKGCVYYPVKGPLAHPIERRYNDAAPLILNLDFLFPAQMTVVISLCFSSPNPPFARYFANKAAATKGSCA